MANQSTLSLALRIATVSRMMYDTPRCALQTENSTRTCRIDTTQPLSLLMNMHNLKRRARRLLKQRAEIQRQGCLWHCCGCYLSSSHAPPWLRPHCTRARDARGETRRPDIPSPRRSTKSASGCLSAPRHFCRTSVRRARGARTRARGGWWEGAGESTTKARSALCRECSNPAWRTFGTSKAYKATFKTTATSTRCVTISISR